NATHNVMELLIDSRYSPKSLETTLLIMTYNQSDRGIVSSMNVITRHIESALRSAQWLAKRVVILHIPNVSSESSCISKILLNEWLAFHGLPANTRYSQSILEPLEYNSENNDNAELGMIRDAYIL